MGAASPFLRSSLTVTFARSPSTCSRPRKRKVQLNPLGAGTRGQAQGAWRRRAGGAALQRRRGARTLSPGLPGDRTGRSPHFLPRGSGPRVTTPSAAPAEAERTHGRTGVARKGKRRAPKDWVGSAGPELARGARKSGPHHAGRSTRPFAPPLPKPLAARRGEGSAGRARLPGGRPGATLMPAVRGGPRSGPGT